MQYKLAGWATTSQTERQRDGLISPCLQGFFSGSRGQHVLIMWTTAPLDIGWSHRQTHVQNNIHTSLIKNDELTFMTVSVCRGGCDCCGREGVNGKGRARFWASVMSFFQLKIEASPGNKGKANWQDRQLKIFNSWLLMCWCSSARTHEICFWANAKKCTTRKIWAFCTTEEFKLCVAAVYASTLVNL